MVETMSVCAIFAALADMTVIAALAGRATEACARRKADMARIRSRAYADELKNRTKDGR